MTSIEPTSNRQRPEDVEVAVVGAGQAGLAIGYFLAQQGRRFVILEAAGSIGSAWRRRWESLTLFTSRRHSGLPGLPFPGDPDGYPARDEVSNAGRPISQSSSASAFALSNRFSTLNDATRITGRASALCCPKSIES